MSHDERLARLLTLSAIQKAKVLANPLPHLERMDKEILRLRRAIDGAIFELSGASAMQIAADIAPQLNPSFVETAVARNRRAAEILAAARRDGAPNADAG
jgi:hypothetical protein